MLKLKQVKARNADVVRSETLTFRLDARMKFLAELAARSQGRKLGNFVETALEQSLKSVVIFEDQEPGYGDTLPTGPKTITTLAEVADSLWSTDEATRFLNVVHIAPWLVTDGESKLLRILQHSNFYAPRGIILLDRIQEHWQTLAAIRDGEAEVDILPSDQRPTGALAFGMKGDAERIALYKSDPAKFKRESEAYSKAMKGRMTK